MEEFKVPKKFPTTVVGSYPKLDPAPEILRKLRKKELDEKDFHELVRPAIKKVVDDYLWAGIDIISDGEQSREDMVVYFAERIKGYTVGDWVRIFDNTYFRRPVIFDKVEWTSPMTIEDWEYARSISKKRPVKAILTGPYTMVEWSFDLYYKDRKEAVLDIAKVIRKEVEEYLRRGVKYVQVDEPALSTRPWREDAELVKEALEIIFRGVQAKRVIHICFGRLERILPYILDYPVDQFDLEFKNSDFRLLSYLKEYSFDKELGYGVIDVHSLQIENIDEIVKDIEKLMKLDIIGPEKIYIDPDCGLKRLPREIARAKLRNMVEAAKIARERW